MAKLVMRLLRRLTHHHALHAPEQVGAYASAYITLRDW
jgi:hypothetical protein